ncbi:ATP-binding cassette domain-containing protein [Gemmatimonadota bacterium]
MIELNDISKSFGGIKALDSISYSFSRGRVSSVVGPNGSGKTTLLNVISGFYTAERGQLWWNNSDESRIQINRFGVAARSRLGIGRSFQSMRGLDEFTVLEYILFNSIPWVSDDIFREGLHHLPAGGSLDQVEALFESGDVGWSRDTRVAHLSYGQRKILDILCLIARGSQVMMLDEPFAGVDAKNLEPLLRILHDCRSDGNKTLIIVSHELSLVQDIAEDCLLMDQGRLLCSGITAEVMDSDIFREVYLG